GCWCRPTPTRPTCRFWPGSRGHSASRRYSSESWRARTTRASSTPSRTWNERLARSGAVVNAATRRVTVAEAFPNKAERLGLVLDGGASGLGRGLETHPALDSHVEFVNYLDLDHPAPVQIIDPGESARLAHPDDALGRSIRNLFESGRVAMVVFSDDVPPPEWLVESGNQTGVCVYHSPLSHSLLYERLQHRAARKLIQQTGLHGVLMSIRSVGGLITGPSGIGKSEVALDLIDRGSRLVADDVVQVYRSA